MKCAVKDCKNKAVYVWVDACLMESGTVIYRREISCYPLCIEHDDSMHRFTNKEDGLGGLKHSKYLEGKLRIKK